MHSVRGRGRLLQRHRTVDNLRHGWDDSSSSAQKRNSHLFSWDDEFWKHASKRGPHSLESSASTFEEVESLCFSKSSSESMGSAQRQWEKFNSGGQWKGPPASKRLVSRQSSTTSTSTSRSSGMVSDAAKAEPSSDYFNSQSRQSITDTLLDSMEFLGAHGNLDIADRFYLETIFQRVLNWNNGIPVSSENAASPVDRHYQAEKQSQQQPVNNSAHLDAVSPRSHAVLKDKLEKLKHMDTAQHYIRSDSSSGQQNFIPEKKKRRDLIIPDEDTTPVEPSRHSQPSRSSRKKGDINREISHSSRETSSSSKGFSDNSASRRSYVSSMSSHSMDNGSLRGSPQGSIAPQPPNYPNLATFLPQNLLKPVGSFESTTSSNDQYTFTQPYTTSHAERVLMGLGFGAAEGFLPERFLKDWYTKLSKAQVESQKPSTSNMKHQESHDNPRSILRNTSRETNSRRASVDINRGPSSQTFQGMHSSAGLYEASTFLPTNTDHDSRMERLKEYISAYSNNTFSIDDEREMKMKQFANSRQKSLPLCLETLTKDEEGKSRHSGIDPFDKEAKLQLFISDNVLNGGQGLTKGYYHKHSHQSDYDHARQENSYHHHHKQQQDTGKHYNTEQDRTIRHNKQTKRDNVINSPVSNRNSENSKSSEKQKPHLHFVSTNDERDHSASRSSYSHHKTSDSNHSGIKVQRSPTRQAAIDVSESTYQDKSLHHRREELSQKVHTEIALLEKEQNSTNKFHQRKSSSRDSTSKDSIEVADIMQNQQNKERNFSVSCPRQESNNKGGKLKSALKHVEPAMISIVLEDVDEKSGMCSADLLSVSQEGIHLVIPLSACNTLSLSPIPQSPVTVIEVSLDNQHDSLDTEGTGSSNDTNDDNFGHLTTFFSNEHDVIQNNHHRRSSLSNLCPRPEHAQRRRSTGILSPIACQLNMIQVPSGNKDGTSRRRLSLEVPVLPEIRQMLEKQKILQSNLSEESSVEQKAGRENRRASFSEAEPIIINDVLARDRSLSPRQGRKSTSPYECYKRVEKRRGSHDVSAERRGSHDVSAKRRGSHDVSAEHIGSHTLSVEHIGSHTLSVERRGSHDVSAERRGSHTLSVERRGSHDVSAERRGSHDVSAKRRGSHDVSAERRSNHDVSVERRGSHDVSAERRGSHDVSAERRGSHDVSAERRGSYDVSVERRDSHGVSAERRGSHGVSAEHRGSNDVSAERRGSHTLYVERRGSHDESAQRRGSQELSVELRDSHTLAMEHRGSHDLSAERRGSYDVSAERGGSYESSTESRGSHELSAECVGSHELSADRRSSHQLSAERRGSRELSAVTCSQPPPIIEINASVEEQDKPSKEKGNHVSSHKYERKSPTRADFFVHDSKPKKDMKSRTYITTNNNISTVSETKPTSIHDTPLFSVIRSLESSNGSTRSAFRSTNKSTVNNSPSSGNGYCSETDVEEFPTNVNVNLKPRPISSIVKNLETQISDCEGDTTSPITEIISMNSESISPPTRFSEKEHATTSENNLGTKVKSQMISRAVEVNESAFPYTIVNAPRNIIPEPSEYYYACDRSVQCDLTRVDFLVKPDINVECLNKFTQTAISKHEISCQTTDIFFFAGSNSGKNSGQTLQTQSKAVNTIVCLVGGEHSNVYKTKSSPHSAYTDYNNIDETIQEIDDELSYIDNRKYQRSIRNNALQLNPSHINIESSMHDVSNDGLRESNSDIKGNIYSFNKNQLHSRTGIKQEGKLNTFAPSSWQDATEYLSTYETNNTVKENVPSRDKEHAIEFKQNNTGSNVHLVNDTSSISGHLVHPYYPQTPGKFKNYVGKVKRCTQYLRNNGARSDSSRPYQQVMEDDNCDKSSENFQKNNTLSSISHDHSRNDRCPNIECSNYSSSEHINKIDGNASQKCNDSCVCFKDIVSKNPESGNHYTTRNSNKHLIKASNSQLILVKSTEPYENLHTNIPENQEVKYVSNVIIYEIDNTNRHVSNTVPILCYNSDTSKKESHIMKQLEENEITDREHSKLARQIYKQTSHQSSYNSLDIEQDFMKASEPIITTNTSNLDTLEQRSNKEQPLNVINNSDPLNNDSVEETTNSFKDLTTSKIRGESEVDPLTNIDQTQIVTEERKTESVMKETENKGKPWFGYNKKCQHSENNYFDEINDQIMTENIKVSNCLCFEHTTVNENEVLLRSLSKIKIDRFGSRKSTPEIVISPIKCFQTDFLKVPLSPDHIFRRAKYPSSSGSPFSTPPTSPLASERTRIQETETKDNSDLKVDCTTGEHIFTYGIDLTLSNDIVAPKVNIHGGDKNEFNDKQDVHAANICSLTAMVQLNSMEQSIAEFSDVLMYPRLSNDSLPDGNRNSNEVSNTKYDINHVANLATVEVESMNVIIPRPPVFDPDFLKFDHENRHCKSLDSLCATMDEREILDVDSSMSFAGSVVINDDMDLFAQESRKSRLNSDSSYSEAVLDISDVLSDGYDSNGNSKPVVACKGFLAASYYTDDLLQVSDFGGLSPTPCQMKDKFDVIHTFSPCHISHRQFKSEDISTTDGIHSQRELPSEYTNYNNDSDDELDSETELRIREQLRLCRRESRRGSKDNWDVIQSVIMSQKKDCSRDLLNLEESCDTSDALVPECQTINNRHNQKINIRVDESSGDECDKEISKINLNGPIIRKLIKMSSDPVDKDIYCKSISMQTLKQKTANLEQENPLVEETLIDIQSEWTLNEEYDPNNELIMCSEIHTGSNATVETCQVNVFQGSNELELRTGTSEKLREVSNEQIVVDTKTYMDEEKIDTARVLDVEYSSDDTDIETSLTQDSQDTTGEVKTDILDEIEMIALFKKIDNFDGTISLFVDYSSESSSEEFKLSEISEEETQSEENTSDEGRQHLWQVRNRFVSQQDTQDTTVDVSTLEVNVRSQQDTQDTTVDVSTLEVNVRSQQDMHDKRKDNSPLEANLHSQQDITIDDSLLDLNLPSQQDIQDTTTEGSPLDLNLPSQKDTQDTTIDDSLLDLNLPSQKDTQDTTVDDNHLELNLPSQQNTQDTTTEGSPLDHNLPSQQDIQDTIIEGSMLDLNLPSQQDIQHKIIDNKEKKIIVSSNSLQQMQNDNDEESNTLETSSLPWTLSGTISLKLTNKEKMETERVSLNKGKNSDVKVPTENSPIDYTSASSAFISHEREKVPLEEVLSKLDVNPSAELAIENNYIDVRNSDRSSNKSSPIFLSSANQINISGNNFQGEFSSRSQYIPSSMETLISEITTDVTGNVITKISSSHSMTTSHLNSIKTQHENMQISRECESGSPEDIKHTSTAAILVGDYRIMNETDIIHQPQFENLKSGIDNPNRDPTISKKRRNRMIAALKRVFSSDTTMSFDNINSIESQGNTDIDSSKHMKSSSNLYDSKKYSLVKQVGFNNNVSTECFTNLAISEDLPCGSIQFSTTDIPKDCSILQKHVQSKVGSDLHTDLAISENLPWVNTQLTCDNSEHQNDGTILQKYVQNKVPLVLHTDLENSSIEIAKDNDNSNQNSGFCKHEELKENVRSMFLLEPAYTSKDIVKSRSMTGEKSSFETSQTEIKDNATSNQNSGSCKHEDLKENVRSMFLIDSLSTSNNIVKSKSTSEEKSGYETSQTEIKDNYTSNQNSGSCKQENLKENVRSMFLLEPAYTSKDIVKSRSVSEEKSGYESSQTDMKDNDTSNENLGSCKKEKLKENIRSMFLLEPPSTSNDILKSKSTSGQKITYETSQTDMKDTILSAFPTQDLDISSKVSENNNTDRQNSYHNTSSHLNQNISTEQSTETIPISTTLEDTIQLNDPIKQLSSSINQENTPIDQLYSLLSNKTSHSLLSLTNRVRNSEPVNEAICFNNEDFTDNVCELFPTNTSDFNINYSQLTETQLQRNIIKNQQELKDNIRSMFLIDVSSSVTNLIEGANVSDESSNLTYSSIRENDVIEEIDPVAELLNTSIHYNTPIFSDESIEVNESISMTTVSSLTDYESSIDQLTIKQNTNFKMGEHIDIDVPNSRNLTEIRDADLKAQVRAMFLMSRNSDQERLDSNNIRTSNNNNSVLTENITQSPSKKLVKVTTMYSENNDSASTSFCTSPSLDCDEIKKENVDEDVQSSKNESMHNIRTQMYNGGKKCISKMVDEKTNKNAKTVRGRDLLLKLHDQVKITSSNENDSDTELISALTNQGDYDIRRRDLALGRISSDNNDEDDLVNSKDTYKYRQRQKTSTNSIVSSITSVNDNVALGISDRHAHNDDELSLPAAISMNSGEILLDPTIKDRSSRTVPPKLLIQSSACNDNLSLKHRNKETNIIVTKMVTFVDDRSCLAGSKDNNIHDKNKNDDSMASSSKDENNSKDKSNEYLPDGKNKSCDNRIRDIDGLHQKNKNDARRYCASSEDNISNRESTDDDSCHSDNKDISCQDNKNKGEKCHDENINENCFRRLSKEDDPLHSETNEGNILDKSNSKPNTKHLPGKPTTSSTMGFRKNQHSNFLSPDRALSQTWQHNRSTHHNPSIRTLDDSHPELSYLDIVPKLQHQQEMVKKWPQKQSKVRFVICPPDAKPRSSNNTTSEFKSQSDVESLSNKDHKESTDTSADVSSV